MPDATVTGPVPDDQILSITVLLRSEHERSSIHAQTMAANQSFSNRKTLSREEFAEKFGANAFDIAILDDFAKQYGLTVTSVGKARRAMTLSGTAAALSNAFGTHLDRYQYPGGNYCGRTGDLSAPDEVVAVIEGVFGLDDRQQVTTKYHLRPAPMSVKASATFTPPELAKIYHFPQQADGNGQCIGIIELGGGSRAADLATYFSGLGIHAPQLIVVSVDSGVDQPGAADGADGEVMLDIEVAGAIAPGAALAVYFAPNTDRGFLDAVSTAIHDTVNKPSVISISWGGAELSWTQQAMNAFESVFADAAAMGIMICVAAGDNGSADGQVSGGLHVDFPASAPHALACGGTSLVVNSAGVATETVWNDAPDSATGGGYSNFFAIPAYQSALKLTGKGRGVPDVAGDADPNTGYAVRVDGQDMVIGGTSAVAPLWAGLIALLNQELGKPVGFLNPILYDAIHAGKLTNDIVVGNNGSQQATSGWDACTGWGSPNGQQLFNALQH